MTDTKMFHQDQELRVAIAHEWLDARAGSEKTFEAMAEAYPTADLFALSVNPAIKWHVGGRRIETTFLDTPQLRNRREWTLPLMPLAWRAIASTKYDLVISSSHACVKGFYPGRTAMHLCYVHSPMRYAWMPEIDKRASRPIMRPAIAGLRSWDKRSAGWVDGFAANSSAVAARINSVYGRDAVVIHPPVDTEFYTPSCAPVERSYLLACSRLIDYKKIDLAIEVASLTGFPLVIAGSGPDEARLRQLGQKCTPGLVHFEIRPSDERLRELYRNAKALIFPAFEDFGIVPVEAQACGTPVIALDQGGARDTVIDGKTGFLVRDQAPIAFAESVMRLRTLGPTEAACAVNAARFGRDAFMSNLKAWVAQSMGIPASFSMAGAERRRP